MKIECLKKICKDLLRQSISRLQDDQNVSLIKTIYFFEECFMLMRDFHNLFDFGCSLFMYVN